jgi:hypothetical protein
MASMENAVATELARAKIEANEVADRLQANLDYLREHAKDYTFLFADTAQIIQKALDDLQALVQNRITTHKADEARKEEETRERIRREEQDRIAREAAAQVAQAAPPAQPAVLPAAVTAILPTGGPREAMGGTVRMFPDAAPRAPASPPTLKFGQIGERLGFVISADFLASLGFPPAATDKNAKLFHEADFPRICAALIQHINSVQIQVAA